MTWQTSPCPARHQPGDAPSDGRDKCPENSWCKPLPPLSRFAERTRICERSETPGSCALLPENGTANIPVVLGQSEAALSHHQERHVPLRYRRPGHPQVVVSGEGKRLIRNLASIDLLHHEARQVDQDILFVNRRDCIIRRPDLDGDAAIGKVRLVL